MQTPSEKLLVLAGLDFTQSDTGDFHGLYESIWKLRHRPDDVLEREVAVQLDSDLAEVLNCMFALDQDMLKARHACAVSGLGRALSQAALSCETHEATQGWLRLRFILDVCWDAILAGDMRPYAETIGHELRAGGVDFAFS